MYNLLNLKTNSAKSDIDVAHIFHKSILSFNKRSSPADYKNFVIPTPYMPLKLISTIRERFDCYENFIIGRSVVGR